MTALILQGTAVLVAAVGVWLWIQGLNEEERLEKEQDDE